MPGQQLRVGAYLGLRSGLGDCRRCALPVVRAVVRVRLARGTRVIAPGTRRTGNGGSVRGRIRLVRPQIRRMSRLGGDPCLGRYHGQRGVRRGPRLYKSIEGSYGGSTGSISLVIISRPDGSARVV